jgi:hypothetical protein
LEEVGLTIDGEPQREIDRLRAEVGELKSQLAAAQADALAHGEPARAGPSARSSRLSWRGPVATLLIIVGCLLAPMSVLGVWTANQVSDTSRYVENVSPLITDPAVQGALTDKITTAITRQINVQGLAKAAAKQLSAHGLTRLGTLLSSLSGSIASAVSGFIHTIVAKVVHSPFVARLWIQGNRIAHTELVKALSGQPSSISVSNGKVVIGLGPFIDQVKRNLANRGLDIVAKLPTINPTFSLFSATYLVRAQSIYRLLNLLKWVLPVVTLVLLAVGVYVAKGHRRALVGAGLGLAAAMLALAVAITVARAIYLAKIPSSVLPADAAAVIFDTLVRFIRQGLRVLLVIGLVVAIAGFFSGPSVTAVRARGTVTSAFSAIRGGAERVGVTTGPVGRWTYRYRTALRVVAIAAAVVVFVFWTDPTGLDVLVIALVLLGVVGLIELIGRPPRAPRAQIKGPSP